MNKTTSKDSYTNVHYVIENNEGITVYICNQACNTTKEKMAKRIELITCKNCLTNLNRMIKEKFKETYDKRGRWKNI